MTRITWQQLTDEERCVLVNAAEQSMLVEVLIDWLPSAEWSSRSRDVPRLAEAAVSLVRAGLIDAYEEPLGLGEAALLFRDEAVEALGDHRNWQPKDQGQPTPEGVKQDSFFSLAITDEGRDVLRSRGDARINAWRCR